MCDRKFFGLFVAVLTVAVFVAVSPAVFENEAEANPCNPCAKKAKNPCAKNPCANDTKRLRSEKAKDFKKLSALGKKLWHDEGLGKSGMSCMTCHEGGDSLNMDKHKGMWPHHVKMADDIMTLDQMINFCMVNPMEAEPLDPNGIKMTAMAAYYHHFAFSHRGKKDGMRHHNPCAKNPCGK